jgi:hypothetical protein
MGGRLKKRVPTKHPVVDGIMTFPCGRQVCVTTAAWERRKMEVLFRAKFVCEVAKLIGRHAHLVSDFEGWTADHIKKRGMNGSTRDDRVENLRLTCNTCHAVAHDRNIHQRENENDEDI